jgi:hypothetical protein
VTVEYPRTAQFRYRFAKQLNAARILTELKKQAPSLKSLCKTALFPAMERRGVKHPEIRFVYVNADRSPLWSYTCKTA